MITKQIVTNKAVLERFATLIKSNRLAHAYLFIGPQDTGKGQTALDVAKLVNCESPVNGMFCERCRLCTRVNGGYHPDVHVIDSSRSEPIKIEQIRQMTCDIQLKAFEAGKKVFIIKNIENMTQESGNALLKTLEEPTPNSLIILTTSVPEKNLATVRSRCHAVHFFPTSVGKLTQKLQSEFGLDEESSRFLAYFSEGYLGRARKFNEEKIFKRKNEVIDSVICSPNSEPYLKKIAADKDKTKELLDVLLSWFRDLLVLKAGADDTYVMNLDHLRELKKAESRYTFEELNGIIDEIINTTRLLSENLNVKIALSLIKEKLWRKS